MSQDFSEAQKVGSIFIWDFLGKKKKQSTSEIFGDAVSRANYKIKKWA
jgi:hypothetical protein